MAQGLLLSEKAAGQVARTVKAVLGTQPTKPADRIGRQTAPFSRVVYCKLDAELLVASDNATGASTATATVWKRDGTTGDLTQSTEQITVVNRSTTVYSAADVFGIAQWVVFEYHFLPLEC